MATVETHTHKHTHAHTTHKHTHRHMHMHMQALEVLLWRLMLEATWSIPVPFGYDMLDVLLEPTWLR